MVLSQLKALVDRLESPTADSSALKLVFQKPALSSSVVFKEGRKMTLGWRSSLKSWRVFTWNDDRWGWEIKRTITDKVLFLLFNEIFNQTCEGKDGSAFTLMEILTSTLSVLHKMICNCNLNLKKNWHPWMTFRNFYQISTFTLWLHDQGQVSPVASCLSSTGNKAEAPRVLLPRSCKTKTRQGFLVWAKEPCR